MIDSAALTSLVGEVDKTNLTNLVTGLSANSRQIRDPEVYVALGNKTKQAWAAGWIADKFIEYGITDTIQHKTEGLSIDGDWVIDVINVVATIPGLKYPDRYIYVGAHYDTINVSGPTEFDPLLAGEWPDTPFVGAPGANDNASGVAALLEIARIIVESGYVPEYSLRFIAIAGEEMGMYGSTTYLAEHKAAEDEVVLFFNIDMIGDNHPDYLNIVEFVEHPTVDSYRLPATALMEEYSGLETSARALLWSDGYVWAGAGYQTVEVKQRETRYDYYHTELDTVDNMDFDYATAIVKGSLACVATFAGLGVQVGQTPSLRYAADFKAGSTSDNTRLVQPDDLVVLTLPDEASQDEKVRVCKAKDLLPSSVSETFNLATTSGNITLSVLVGVAKETV